VGALDSESRAHGPHFKNEEERKEMKNTKLKEMTQKVDRLEVDLNRGGDPNDQAT